MAEIRSIQAMLASSRPFRDIEYPTEQEIETFLESEKGEVVRRLLERLACNDIAEATRWILIAAEWGARDKKHPPFSAKERSNFAEAIEKAAKRLQQLIEFEHANECVDLSGYMAGALPVSPEKKEPETDEDWANEEIEWQALQQQNSLVSDLWHRCPDDLKRIRDGARKASLDFQSNRKFDKPKRPSYKTIANFLVDRVLFDNCDPDITYAHNRSLAALFRITCDLGGIPHPSDVMSYLQDSIRRSTE